MLQQTTVATVAPRFERFVARWPTIEALAAASDEDILAEWAGLGYYARARNLIACAREIARRGAFPTTAAELAKLPGIGAYTSAAIASIAFGEKVAAVDTNVQRVIARLYSISDPDRADIERRTLELMPADRAGDFIQALMDLGATICRQAKPRCCDCPLRADCAAHASGMPEFYPHRRKREARPQKSGVAYWTERDSYVWLVRRPPNGMLGGMAALPGTDWHEQIIMPPNPIGTLRHVFTHFALDLSIVECPEPSGDGWWQPIEQLGNAGLPTLYRRAVELAVAAREASRAAA